MANRHAALRIQGHALVIIEKRDLLRRDSQRLGGHHLQILGREPLPTRLFGEIQVSDVDQSFWLDADPLSPIQIQARVEQLGACAGVIPGAFVQGSAARINTDRKSTRLNSSHLVISYAVFCLKKKKNTSY